MKTLDKHVELAGYKFGYKEQKRKVSKASRHVLRFCANVSYSIYRKDHHLRTERFPLNVMDPRWESCLHLTPEKTIAGPFTGQRA